MKNQTWQQHSFINKIHTLILLSVMAGFLALLGWILWGTDGAILLVISSILLSFFTPAISPKLVMKLYNGYRLPLSQIPELQNILIDIIRHSGLRFVPEIYYLPSSMVNAFTVGRQGQACIALTDGFFRTLNLREARGVLAHEISHLKSNDLSVMALADMFSRLTSILSLFGQLFILINIPLLMLGMMNIDWLAIGLLIFSPTISTLAQLGLSRIREYDADLNAARLTSDPVGLANALVKIDRIENAWIERLFLPGRRLPEPSLLRTHPPTEERVRRLLALQHETAPSTITPAIDEISLHQNLLPKHIKKTPKWHISGLWH